MTDLARNDPGMPRQNSLQLGIGATPALRLEDLRQEIALGLEQLNRGESAPWGAAMLKDKLRRQFSRATP